MTLREVVKKSILFGLGAVYLTKDEVEKFIKGLEVDGKITPEEARKVVKDVWNEAEEKFKRANLKKRIDAFLNETEAAVKKSSTKKTATTEKL